VPAPRDPEVLLRAARLYYEDRLSQDEVAARLGTSRSNVSRMLTAAFEQGIVEIRVNDPAGREGELERALADRFGLDAAVVAVRGAQPGTRPDERVAALAWQWLRGGLRDGMTLGLGWGRTLQALVSAVDAASPVAVEVVQLVGGLSTVGDASTGQELVRETAARLQARYRYLHAPAVLTSAGARDTLLAEAAVREPLDAARRADVAVVGIGAVGCGTSEALLRALDLSPAERRAFDQARPVGDVAARYFDAHGREVRGPVHDRVLAVTLDELRAVPTVVAVVHGREKVDAVAAALAGGLVDVLVCDDVVARGVLAHPSLRAVPA
jgi:DNA-binding transcriptional regulator LsrR (DeoR family)